jgi:RNA polymerase sigma factor (sigma-70 family)
VSSTCHDNDATLGDLLYANQGQEVRSETDWLEIVRGIAASDPLALHALYERTHRLVFTLLMRVVNTREAAEKLTLKVFHEVWRGAHGYDAQESSVLGWVMNLAHSSAVEHLPRERRSSQKDSDLPYALSERRGRLRHAMTRLTHQERHAVQSAFFSELSYADVATALNEPLTRVRARIHSGLGKLWHGMQGNEGSASSPSEPPRCDQSELVSLYVLQALPAGELPSVERHIFSCTDCQQDMRRLRPVIDAFVSWPTDVLRPSASLRTRLASLLAAETNGNFVLPVVPPWAEPRWYEVAQGIFCKLLATDSERDRVSMLVRLAPGTDYPPHRHAGVEELHLLEGELWIDDRKLCPGDSNRAETGTSDQRVWSETGCTCVLVTSTRDVLRPQIA